MSPNVCGPLMTIRIQMSVGAGIGLIQANPLVSVAGQAVNEVAWHSFQQIPCDWLLGESGQRGTKQPGCKLLPRVTAISLRAVVNQEVMVNGVWGGAAAVLLRIGYMPLLRTGSPPWQSPLPCFSIMSPHVRDCLWRTWVEDYQRRDQRRDRGRKWGSTLTVIKMIKWRQMKEHQGGEFCYRFIASYEDLCSESTSHVTITMIWMTLSWAASLILIIHPVIVMS